MKLVALNSDPSKIIQELHFLIKKSNLKEILCDDRETLSMVCNSLQIWVLIQDIVINVQEKLERVLVQEMYLKDKRGFFYSLESCCLIVNGLCYQTAMQQPGLESGSAYLALNSKYMMLLVGRRTHPTCFSDSMVK